MKPLVLLAVMAALGGCAAGPSYRAPEPAPELQTPFVTTTAGTAAGQAPRQEWWKLYESPELDTLVATAFDANRDLRAAAANLQAAQAIVSEAKSARLPSTTITGSATYGKNQQPQFSSEEDWQYQGRGELAYEVDLFGRVRRSIEAARADANAEQFTRDAVQVRVAASVTQAYVSACTSAEAIEAVRTSVDLASESLRITEAKERAGSAASLDVDRANAALARARASLAPLESQRQLALFELAALLGRPPSGVPASAADCKVTPAPRAAIPIGDGALLLKRRPDIAAAERRLAASTARIGVATAELYPTVSIGASASQIDADGIHGSNGFGFGVGPALSFNFPNQLAARAQVRQAEARTQASLAQFDGVVLNALKETEQALASLGSAQERQTQLLSAEERAGSAFRRADLLYRAGSIGYLDLIVAQNELLDTRLTRVQAEQQLSEERVRLFRALGGGWGQD